MLNSDEFIKFVENEATSTKSIGCQETTLSSKTVDIMMVHILQINDKKSMPIQTLVEQLEQISLSCNKLGGKWFSKCVNAKPTENHYSPRTRIHHMETDDTAIKKLKLNVLGADKKAKPVLNKSKPCRVKKNQIGSLEWDNSVVVKDSSKNDGTLVIISLPSHTMVAVILKRTNIWMLLSNQDIVTALISILTVLIMCQFHENHTLNVVQFCKFYLLTLSDQQI